MADSVTPVASGTPSRSRRSQAASPAATARATPASRVASTVRETLACNPNRRPTHGMK